MTAGHAPPGWPAEVLPPDVDGWIEAAVAWLLDYGDPEWRHDPTYERHPVVLARIAQLRAHALVQAARDSWGDVPLLVAYGLPQGAAAGARAMLEREGPALAARAVAIDLVHEALRGVRWVPRL